MPFLIDHSTLQQTQQQVNTLEERNAVLEVENAQLRDKCARVTEESNMEKFKCQLLVEMVRPRGCGCMYRNNFTNGDAAIAAVAGGVES
jgi:regulator of replication initiation timing